MSSTTVNKVHFNCLDTFRGIAALMVVQFHFSGFKGSYLAVDFFFVLSGFVIAHAYLYKQRTLQEFIVNRIARLYPLHLFTFVTFIAVALLSGMEIPQYPDGNTFIVLQHLTLTHNIGFSSQSGYTFNYPSWSISVEFWVSIIIVCFISRYTRTALLFFVSTIFLIIIYNHAYNLLGASTHNIYMFVNSGLLRGAAGFLLGIVAYRIYLAYVGSISQFWVVVCQLACLFAAVILIFNRQEMFSRIDVFAPFLFMLMVAAFAIEVGFLCFLLNKIKWLGLISYSIYLNHAGVIIMTKLYYKDTFLNSWYMTILLVLCYSVVTYWLIEKKLGIWLKKQLYRMTPAYK